jgi:hypothetical protein
MAALPLLATLPDLGSMVGETIADADPTATLFLRLASGIVRDDLRQVLSPVADDVVKLSPINGFKTFLPELPITDFTQLETLEHGVWSVIDPTRYIVDDETGSITAAWGQIGQFPAQARSWRATYSHGFAEIPDAIQNAVLGLASRAWETPIGVENERVGARSIKYLMLDGGYTPAEQLGLNRYYPARG